MKKEQQIYILIGIGVIVFVFFYFNFLLGPVNKSIKNKKEKIKELTNTIAEAKREIGQLEQLRTKVAILEYELKELQTLLPEEKDLPDLLRKINKVAQHHGIKITILQPRPIITTTSQEYNEIPFGLQITGTFHNVGNFLAEIGQEKRLFLTRDLQLSQQLSSDKSTTVGGSLTLIAYMTKGAK
ncbi:MAG: type 4a pilus biogenesis protein PilO [Endomicrobiia bacterium]